MQDGDVRIQIVRIEFGWVDGEFMEKVVLCQDSGLSISTSVSIKQSKYSMQCWMAALCNECAVFINLHTILFQTA